VTIAGHKPLRWAVSREEGKALIGVPGLAFGNGPYEYAIGRSHLPLLDLPEARLQMLALAQGEPKNFGPASFRWMMRDRATELKGFKLRVTQQSGIDFVQARRGSLVGDDMRSGKSLLAMMSHDPASGQLVIVAPLMSRAMWLGWLRRVFPGLTIGIIIGRTFDAETIRHPIVFGHYDVIAEWMSLNMKIGTLVFDEAHAISKRNSRRSRAASVLAMKAERVIAMTGTPIWNMPPGLWNLLATLMPGEWGSFYDFAFRYGLPEPTSHGTKFTGISHEDELRSRMSEVMIRRRWIDITSDLPAISRTVVLADLDEKAKRKLDIEAASILEGGSGNTAANLAAYRRAASRYKVGATVVEATKILDAGEPVVVWAWHVDTAKLIAEKLGARGLSITGEDAPHVRDRRIEAWKSVNGQASVALVATMAVAREAIDLSHARFCVFAELSETPAIVAQAEMRTFSPLRPMSVAFVVANHIVDHRLVRILERKLTAATAVGVGTASDSIEALRSEVFGVVDDGDMSRFLDDLLEGCDD
jgi:hypothetical protein